MRPDQTKLDAEMLAAREHVATLRSRHADTAPLEIPEPKISRVAAPQSQARSEPPDPFRRSIFSLLSESSQPSSLWNCVTTAMLADKPANPEALPLVISMAKPVSKPSMQLVVGVHVLSSKYGQGMVLRVDPGAEKGVFTVQFAHDHRVEYSASLAKKKLQVITMG